MGLELPGRRKCHNIIAQPSVTVSRAQGAEPHVPRRPGEAWKYPFSGVGVRRGRGTWCEWGAATFCGATGFRRGLLQPNFTSPPRGEGLRVTVYPAQPKPAHFPAPPQGHSRQHPLPFSATTGCCPGFRWPGGCSVHCRQIDQFPLDSFLTKCCRCRVQLAKQF